MNSLVEMRVVIRVAVIGGVGLITVTFVVTFGVAPVAVPGGRTVVFGMTSDVVGSIFAVGVNRSSCLFVACDWDLVMETVP